MQVRERDDRGGRVQGSRTERTSGGHHSKGFLAPFFASMAIATCLTMPPAKADFVCNAKTKLVNVFLEPPSYWSATPPKDETASQMRDRLEEEQRRAARGPGFSSPADAMKEPFDIVDTLPSGARVKVHGSSDGSTWFWISFRHSQNGLVGQGYIHVSKLSAIPCDADPKDATRYIELAARGQQHGDFFEKSLVELDDVPLEGARGAKRFETRRLSGAIRTHEVFDACEPPPKDFALPKHPMSTELMTGIRVYETDNNSVVRDCSRLLAQNPNNLIALINRGDWYHSLAKSATPGIDSKSTLWAADIKRRKESQAKAVGDWTRASLLLPKDIPTGLEDRLKPTGAAGYEVK